MAAQTLNTTIHKTLSGTTADTITVASSTPQGVEILNRSTTSPLWVRADGTVAVAAADGTVCLLAGQAAVLRGVITTISVVGTDNDYSAHIVGAGLG